MVVAFTIRQNTRLILAEFRQNKTVVSADPFLKDVVRTDGVRMTAQRRKRPPKIKLPRTPDDFFAKPEQFQSDYEKSARVVSKMRAEGLPLREAAKGENININPRTVPPLVGRALKRRSNGSYAVAKTDSLLRVLHALRPEGMREVVVRGDREASKLSQYWIAVHEYIGTGNNSGLKKFKGRYLRDAKGEKITFITDETELKRFGYAGVLSFESLYSRSA